jgi:hypothetical protein
MLSLISRNIPKSLWGKTALMFIVLAIVLAVFAGIYSAAVLEARVRPVPAATYRQPRHYRHAFVGG